MIITPEIERLKTYKSNWVKAGSAKHFLELLLAKHPELDYADELLAFVKDVVEYHIEVCGGVSWRDCGCVVNVPKAEALIAKIEGKK